MRDLISILFLLCSYRVILVQSSPISEPLLRPRFNPGTNSTVATLSTVLPFPCSPNPAYGQFDIPQSNLRLHLTLGDELKPDAIAACLRSCRSWLGGQRPNDEIPKKGFNVSWPFVVRIMTLALEHSLSKRYRDLSNASPLCRKELLLTYTSCSGQMRWEPNFMWSPGLGRSLGKM